MLRRGFGALVLTVALLGMAHALEKTDDKTPPLSKERLPAFYKKLSLGEEQKKKILQIRAESRKKVDSLRAKIERLRMQERADCEAVLTPQQLKHLKELRTGATSSPVDKPKE
jgi:Spy/CpxP family protein refolding chaperone